MRKFLSLTCAAIILCACADQGVQKAQAAAGDDFSANWAMMDAKSTLSFTSDYDGEAFTGHFSKFTTQIKFDADDLAHAKVIATIDLSSVDANDAERTAALPGKDWFYVKSFPQAIFEAENFTHMGENTYQANGTLTLRGVSKPLVLDFTLDIDGGEADMKGTAHLNRRDFDIGRGMWKSDEYIPHIVDVKISLHATKVTP